MAIDFPHPFDAPIPLLAADNHCGLIAAWTVLRFFAKRTTVRRLRTSSGYTKTNGVYAIGLALALREHGLGVRFHTDRDPGPAASERKLYAEARRRGIAIGPALSVPVLVAMASPTCVPIVLYQADRDPHFSPVLGQRRGRVLMPLADVGFLSARALAVARRQPGILRQTVVVTPTVSRGLAGGA